MIERTNQNFVTAGYGYDAEGRLSTLGNGAETFYYVLDGNKNVLGLLNSSNVRGASYTYGPFGQFLTSEGALAQANPFRFSSEFHDDETGLVYYNYRYYNPALGRWTKRDPIEERRGFNLCTMVNNASIDKWDILGFNSFGQLPGAPFGITWWHLEQEEKRRNNPPVIRKTNFWYCERIIDPEGLSIGELLGIRVSSVQHAYISIGTNPWSGEDALSGYGLRGAAQKPGTMPIGEKAFAPTKCKPCYQDNSKSSRKLTHGNGKDTCCSQATDEQIKSCISAAPIKKEYSIPNDVCWTWAEETLSECCLDCSREFVFNGKYKNE